MKILISIVSDQTIPNILFIREVKEVDRYIFISTKKMEGKNKTKHIIDAAGISTENIDIVDVIEDSISDIENKARLIAIQNKKRVVAVMDHWVLYKESLVYKNKLNLPNEIWVTNNYAYLKAKKEFKKIIIKKKINFLEESIKKIKKNNKKTSNYLYILEPINNSIEFIVFNNFIFKFFEHIKVFFIFLFFFSWM